MKLHILLSYWLLLKVNGFGQEGKHDRNTKFYLYSQNNPNVPQELLNNNGKSIKMSNFNSSLPTKILIHGWLGCYNDSFNVPLREAYLSQNAYNVISVDWRKESGSFLYFPAVANVPMVGDDVAKFVDFLNEKFYMTFDSLLLIGHSLGAHVAGFCGKSVRRGKLSHIVGLDAASPFFNYDDPDKRLAKTDAKYVETIHTNGRGKGFLEPIGTVSFYANWGRFQPGCIKGKDGDCSHTRSISLYAQAIKGYSFDPIYKCKCYDNILDKSGCTEAAEGVKIGDPTQMENKAGIYYFETNSKAPYGHK
ncbi:phospholipase A1-like isoform 1-T3 [Cochliomyia hominivorax]